MTWSSTKLPERCVLAIDGPDACDLLQGLITNDVGHLSIGVNHAIYAFLLNHLGRIIADVLIYKQSNESLLLECDQQLFKSVHRNLQLHKLKKKVTLKARSDFDVVTVFPSQLTERPKVTELIDVERLVINDPRLPGLGLYRALLPKGLQLGVSDLSLNDVKAADEAAYCCFRFQNGLSEGARDLISGNSFPLESNGDYLNAISFFKGCYVGQELTARTYHTGVTRKRLMPVSILNGSVRDLEPSAKITNSDGKKRLGRLRSLQGRRGLALLYCEEVLKSEGHGLFIGQTELRTWKPDWWPQSAKGQHLVASEIKPTCGGDHEITSKERLH